MSLRVAQALVMLLGLGGVSRAADTVIDFEQAEIGKPVPTWADKGVEFKLAGPPVRSKAVGRIMFFPHLGTQHKGLLNAMATEQAIPVQATFPQPVSAVTLVLWGSTGCPALLEALDQKGQVVDKVALDAIPGRKTPADPVPFFELHLKAPTIAAIRLSGPRDGEFLAIDELSFTPAAAR